MKFDPAVYPECQPKTGLEKVACLISQIKRDSIAPDLKAKRIRYLIALNAKHRWAPKKTVKALVQASLDPIGFRKGTKARKKRGEIARAIIREKRPVTQPYAVATAVVKRMKHFDVWYDPRFTMKFPAHVEVLYLTRKDVEEQHARGQISEQDYQKYWKGVDAKHLEEFAIRVSGESARKLRSWVRTWGHKGGSWYMKDGYAIRCGGANQSQDPLNVFILFE
jgi:hypothetical protein